MSKRKTLPPVPEIEIPPARFILTPLPAIDFFAGVECREVGDNQFKLSLGEHSLSLFYEGKGFKIRINYTGRLGEPKALERSLGVNRRQAGIEGAVCFLRALNRGELSKIVTRYADAQ